MGSTLPLFVRRLPYSVALVAVLFGVASCGSSEQPEAYPGQPLNPPGKKDDLLDMMTGGTVTATATVVPAVATATATATTSPTATGTATSTAAAKTSKPKAATATPKTAKPEAPPK